MLRRILQNGFELLLMRRTGLSPDSKERREVLLFIGMPLVSSFNEMEIKNIIELCPFGKNPLEKFNSVIWAHFS